MNEPLAPFFSELVTPSHAAQSTTWFGTTWQEIVTRVEGFQFDASDRILGIQNLTHDEQRHSMHCYVAAGTKRYFLLYPTEYITRVDIASTEVVITGLRIHTSQRFTPWFGHRAGSTTTLEASEGFCINALRGSRNLAGCTQLGVVYVPVEVATEGHSITPPGRASPVFCINPNRSEPFQFRTAFQPPRAVVVTLSEEDSVIGLRVVSRAEYDRLMRFDGPLDQNNCEHWLVLADDERVQSVSIGVVGEEIVRVHLETNMQTSPYFGRSVWNGLKTKRFDCERLPNEYIAGFSTRGRVNKDDEPRLTSVAVVYARDGRGHALTTDGCVGGDDVLPSSAA